MIPTWEREGISLYLGDCLKVLPALEANSIDAIVTDPPYGLSFMGKQWDHGLPGTPFWLECIRVAKPGAHLLAFGGTRTWHRLACAIEDAGWEIRDTVMWVYGSGFPKSHDISKAIDREAGAEREVVGRYQPPNGQAWNLANDKRGGNLGAPVGLRSEHMAITAPATPAARQWDGWGTALKPAQESIAIAHKPLDIDSELNIIVGNLSRLEAQLWLLSNAKIADGSSVSSQAGQGGAFATAQWSADDLTSTQAALCDQMDMSQLEQATATILSTVSSWLDTWAEALSLGSTFITETVTSPIIGLKTLSCSASALTPPCTIQAAMIAPGSWWTALPAARVLHAAAMNLSATLERFAVESAIEKGLIPSPDAIDQTILSRPIIVARKPVNCTVAENVLKWGTGGMNIDGCRVENNGKTTARERNTAIQGGNLIAHRFETDGVMAGGHPAGRWPANLIHDGSDEVLAGFPNARSAGLYPSESQGTGNGTTYLSIKPQGQLYQGTGSAARFFYCAKASRADRDEGLEGMALRPAPKTNEGLGRECSLADRMATNGDMHPRQRNHHPTVKPTALMRYLCRLVTPPGGVILDPFMGSGSTGKAARLEGFAFVGIEQDTEYCEIARRRIEAAQGQGRLGI